MSAIIDLQKLVARLTNVTAKCGILVPPPSLVRKLVSELQPAINSAICESYDTGYDMAEEVELCVENNTPETKPETAQIIELAKFRK